MEHNDPPRVNDSITAMQAFLAMNDFIREFSKRQYEDFTVLIVETTIEDDGWPLDPAAWDDWLRSIDRVLAGQQLRQ